MIEHLMDKNKFISKLIDKFGQNETIDGVIDLVNNMPLISYEIEVDFSRSEIPFDKFVIFPKLGVEIFDRITDKVPDIKIYWKMKTITLGELNCLDYQKKI